MTDHALRLLNTAANLVTLVVMIGLLGLLWRENRALRDRFNRINEEAHAYLKVVKDRDHDNG